MTNNLQKKIVEMLTFNWKPKLILLGLAILVWVVVDCFFVQPSATPDGKWLDDIRRSLPE